MLSKTAVHALRAVVLLAREPESYLGAATIADRIGAPRNYLGKLLQSLAQEGIVHSQKGLGGGFRLVRDPDSLSLFDVVEPIDHVSRWSGCFLGNSECNPSKPCAMHERWARVRGDYLNMLRTSTVANLARQPETA